MKPIQSILIANRGEIASRVIRTCRKMGIRSIAVFSEADRFCPFVAEADVAIHIGASSPSESYLDQDKIVAAAHKTKADAIHPGYGFLSENAGFARRLKKEGIIFIGPNPEAIEAMGSKSSAKSLMEKSSVPVVPGYQGSDQSEERLMKECKTIGFPVLLKASAGGGGKGMRIVRDEKELKKAIEAAKREALNAFGDDQLIVEKYIDSGRHIEFQIMGDQQGNILHLHERECSIQRRYQKVIEESPSPVMDPLLRKKMGQAALNAAEAINYDNAGTVEFIFDEKTNDFYFLEVNTRLQVEHPVTEAITGLDLVQLQIEIAQGIPLSLQQTDITSRGYAIEARLYAEDPATGFLPVTGKILRFEYPEVDGLRIETAVKSGSEISVFYDPMIAKIIIWGRNRPTAHRKMQYVLRNMVCQGIKTNQDFLLNLLENAEFQVGNYDTHFIENHIDLSRIDDKTENDCLLAMIAATLIDWKKREDKRTLLRSIPSGWRNSFYQPQSETYFIDEKSYTLSYRFKENHRFEFYFLGDIIQVQFIKEGDKEILLEIADCQYTFKVARLEKSFFIHNEQTGNISLQQKERFPIKEKEKMAGGYETPMPSQIIKVLVKEGQEVTAGQALVILSSMKMEQTVEAVSSGKVAGVYAEEGQNVEAGFLLLKLDEKEVTH